MKFYPAEVLLLVGVATALGAYFTLKYGAEASLALATVLVLWGFIVMFLDELTSP